MTLTLDPLSQQAYHAMRNTHDNILLLGKAGTGKSTLIKTYITNTLESKNKNIAVVAPTGVAAINIGGQTIHSFFKFGGNVSLDDARQRAQWHKKQKIYKALETLIIDEISMVRADLLDCIDIFLRTVRSNHRPFGGVQVIMVGDILQLPPIVSSGESQLFSEHYTSAYFFDAKVMQHPACDVQTYILEKVYRQEDGDFVELLHRIRNATASLEDLTIINNRVQRVTTIEPGEIYITTTNARASQVNATMLSRLPGEEYISFAGIKGKITPASYPTDEELTLKIGAQVMFVLNNPELGFANGTLGTITDIIQYEFDDMPNELEVLIRVKGKKEAISIQSHTREIRESQYDEKEKTIKTQVVGSFEQLPIRLAWACTIHKAQGKTFDSMIIDSGNGMFAAGQAYVALSRCTSLSGIKLIKPLRQEDIMIDPVVSIYLENIDTSHTQHSISTSESISIHSYTKNLGQDHSHMVTPAVRKAFADRINHASHILESSSPHSILVFDTETTGVDKSARIVQIACALYEKNDTDHTRSCSVIFNHLINPLCPIPPETTAVHGVDNDMVKDAPTLDMVRDELHILFTRAQTHIAHNHAFDQRILLQEARRLKLPKIPKRDIYCTMQESVDVIRIPSPRGGYKRPKLAELYTHLRKQEITGYHDALVDIKAAAACYFKLQGIDFDPLK